MTTQNTQSQSDNTNFIATVSTFTQRCTINQSFSKGQGANPDLCDKLDIENLKVSYLGGALTFNFTSQAHKDCHHAMLFNSILKDKGADYIQRLFEHLGSGEYLSLNHTSENVKVSVDKYAQYKTLFDGLGVEEVRSNGKGSKLVQLICTPTPETVTILTVHGFSNITPLVENFVIIGLKVELPTSE